MDKNFIYITIAVIVGFSFGKIVWIPIEDKLNDKIVVNNKEELKTVIDTLDVRTFKVSVEDSNITVIYTKPFDKDDLTSLDDIRNYLFVILIVMICILGVLWVFRWARNR